MRRTLHRLLILLAASWPAAADAQSKRPAPDPRAYIKVYGATAAPYGFAQLCEREPRHCDRMRPDGIPPPITREQWPLVVATNTAVNKEIGPETDMVLHKQTEYWTIPTAKGDCEDYALLKKWRLEQSGLPVGSIRLTVVRDEHREGHTVLTVRTLWGDYILDNKHDVIKRWYETPYDFVMIQSILNPRAWLSLEAAP